MSFYFQLSANTFAVITRFTCPKSVRLVVGTLMFDSVVESHHKNLKTWYSHLSCLMFSVENKLASSLVVYLDKAFNGMPLPLSG